MINHDANFKQLLTTCFVDFIELFFPQTLNYLNTGSLEFLDKEFFTDIPADYRREADIVIKTKFRNRDAFFIVLVENQGRAEADFAQRVFFYVAILHQKEKLPVYPIVVYYGDRPRKPQPDSYRIEFDDLLVLEFHYQLVQLNRLNWRDFVRHDNPVAVALMTKMNYAPHERPYVKLQCLRWLLNSRLDKRKMELIAGFVETYLQLDADEEKIFQQEFAKIPSRKRAKYMEYISPWRQEGIRIGEERGLKKGKQLGLKQGKQLGLKEGKQLGMKEGELKLVLRLLRRRVGRLPSVVRERIENLPLPELEKLSLALLQFSTVDDLNVWLNKSAGK